MNYQFQETEERAQRIAYLISGYVNKTLTTVEHDELDQWVDESDDNVELFCQLTDERNIAEAMAFMKGLNKDKAYEKIQVQLFPEKKKPKWVLPVSIAATLLIVFAIGWFIKSKTVGTTPPAVEVADNPTDKQPGAAKAVLQLANGKTIELQASTKGQVASEGTTVVSANHETLSYTKNGAPSNGETFNTLTVPRGGKYKLILADGSQVWINAASSIKYPVAFGGKERKVFIEGEAFFDITKDEAKPFIVQTNDASIQVLGTSFNVNTYIDEPNASAALVSGKIKVLTGKREQVLSPGQQANILPSGDIKMYAANLQEVTGWKEDRFIFKDEPIENIMRQLARWYNIKVEYKGNVTAHFNASIARSEPLSTILRVLDQTKRVHFTIHADTVEVSP